MKKAADLYRFSVPRQSGFTLLELLVVVVIVAILFTYTTLAIRSNSPEDLIREEASRLQRLTELALQEAILRGEEYALEVHLDGYRFLHFSDNRWLPLTRDPILRERELPLDMQLEMRLEATEIVIDPAAAANPDPDAEQTSKDKNSSLQAAPQIFLLSSGEITPEFDIRFYISGVATSYFVRGLFDGTLQTELSDL